MLTIMMYDYNCFEKSLMPLASCLIYAWALPAHPYNM